MRTVTNKNYNYKKRKGNYQMLDNLNNNVENSRAQGLDVNDDEVEIDLLEIFYAT